MCRYQTHQPMIHDRNAESVLDGRLRWRSDAHAYHPDHNARAVTCADGTQLILATNLMANPKRRALLRNPGVENALFPSQKAQSDGRGLRNSERHRPQTRRVEPLVASRRTPPHRLPCAMEAGQEPDTVLVHDARLHSL